MYRALVSCMLLLVAAATVQAQRSYSGVWTPSGHSSYSLHRLPSLNNERLASLDDGAHGGFQFAHVIDYHLDAAKDGAWTVLENGDRVWSVTLVSDTALSLGCTLEHFHIPEGGELYVIGDKLTLGAYTHKNIYSNGRFTTQPMVGSSLTLEYYQPASVRGEPTLKIIAVAHGYRTLGFGDSGFCNINVACDDGQWADQIRGVGMLLTGIGSRYCSGSLVNNADSDGTVYFLSANHCSVGTGDQVMLNYESPNCSPNSDGPTSNVIAGLRPVASNTYSDFDLILVEEEIPSNYNVFLNGLSAINEAATDMTGIHHPSGDVKKICYAHKTALPHRWTPAEPGYWHWEVSSWDDGTTEPGSSGSPLFDQNQRIVGQLHGGAASCTNIDYDSYGAVWASWDNGMSEYLDPRGTGTLLINGTDLNLLRKH